MVKNIILTVFLISLIFASSGVLATTYYIDWVAGSDSNDGLTKTTPWKSVPGMYSCSNNCTNKKISGGKPGDRFILKGGVTWPRASLSWDWYFGSGIATNPIYFGVDQNWFAGAAWSRPILDAEGGLPNTSPEGIKAMLRLYGDGFVLDNLEFKGLAQLNDSLNPIQMVIVGTSSPSREGIEVKNCYFHGWSHGGTATRDYMIVLNSPNMSINDIKLIIHHNVFDGSDTTKDMAMAYKGSSGHFYNNYIRYMTNGYVGNNARFFWGNTFKDIAINLSFDPTSHMNSIENMTGQSVIYNNFFDNVHGGVTIWVQPKGNEDDFIFNNVIINDYNQGVQIDSRDLLAGNTSGVYIFNNSMQADETGGARIAGSSSSPYMDFIVARNNILIGGGVPRIIKGNTNTLTTSSNIEMTNNVAASLGYITTTTDPIFSNTDMAYSGTGTNLNSFCASLPSVSPSLAADACLKSTTLGVKYDINNHTVIGDNKSTILRDINWDIGAYQNNQVQVQITLPRDFQIIQ